MFCFFNRFWFENCFFIELRGIVDSLTIHIWTLIYFYTTSICFEIKNDAILLKCIDLKKILSFIILKKLISRRYRLFYSIVYCLYLSCSCQRVTIKSYLIEGYQKSIFVVTEIDFWYIYIRFSIKTRKALF